MVRCREVWRTIVHTWSQTNKHTDMNRLFRFFLAALVSFVVISCNKVEDASFASCKGVWASDDAEAVITDSLCIFYYRADSTTQAVVEIPSSDFSCKTVFEPGGVVTTTSSDVEPLTFSKKDSVLDICGHSLKKVEDIKTVQPYEMPQCKSGLDVGKCLQAWRLGVRYEISGDKTSCYCEVNTNRHMFVYSVMPSMTYIRAAATRNDDNGTLFFQNIRMMKNQGTEEYTSYMDPDNFNRAKNDLEMDNTKFQPNSCTFSPDGGIYWSLISFEPDVILINGCGETYAVDRPDADSYVEWIEYAPYSSND